MVNFENIRITMGKFFTSLVICVGIVSGGIYWQAYETSQLKTNVRYLAEAIREVKKDVRIHEDKGNALTIMILRNEMEIINIKGALNKQGIKLKNEKIVRR